jgi:hypothetical protein
MTETPPGKPPFRSDGRPLAYRDPSSWDADETGPNPDMRRVLIGHRRSGEDRRTSSRPLRRNEVDSRSNVERRKLKFEVFFKRAVSEDLLADWLEANCRQRWCIVYCDVSRQSQVREISVMFELADDAARFRETVLGGR